MQASKKVPQLPTPSNTTTADLTDLAKGMRDLTAALRRFIEHLDSDSDYSEGVSEETRRELESEFFATRRGDNAYPFSRQESVESGSYLHNSALSADVYRNSRCKHVVLLRLIQKLSKGRAL